MTRHAKTDFRQQGFIPAISLLHRLLEIPMRLYRLDQKEEDLFDVHMVYTEHGKNKSIGNISFKIPPKDRTHFETNLIDKSELTKGLN